MKRALIMTVAAMLAASCSPPAMEEADWGRLKPEMNAHLKYLYIDYDDYMDQQLRKMEESYAPAFIEYELDCLPDAIEMVEACIDSMYSYQEIAELPDLSENIVVGDSFFESLSMKSSLKSCLKQLCDFVRDEFNGMSDFTLSFPQYYDINTDDGTVYYTTYCLETAEYYMIIENLNDGNITYSLQGLTLE